MGALFGVFGRFCGAEAERMGERLAHRGRHRQLVPVGEEFVLGAIDGDPGGGVRHSGERWAVAEASIFNSAELAEQTRRPDGTPGPLEPAEVILSLYERSGPRGIEAIDGNFAFAIVDRRAREIALGRDYFGCAPLYYTALPSGGVAFASEYKALLCLSELKPRADRDMLQYLQHAKKLPADRTLLANVHAVMPGHVVVLDERGARIRSHAFSPLEVDARIDSEGEAIRRICGGLEDSLRRRSEDLDPIGVALSGGIDSIGVAFLLRRIHPDREIHTFTAGHGPSDPEVHTAARVARQIGSIHHEVITPPELLRERLRHLVWHLEDPFAGSEVPQLFEIGNVAKEHVRVLLSGQGADSLFGGMPRYKILWLMKRLRPLRKPLTEFYSLTQTGLKPTSLIGRSLDWVYFRGRVPRVPRIEGATWTPGPVRLPAMSDQLINEAMAAGFQSGQCQDTLKFERSFGAWGVGYRSPFSEVRFARSAYTISDSLKIRRGVEKYILRQALATVVPREFLKTPKFPQRMKCDVKFSEALDEIAASLFAEEAVRERGLFAFESIEQLRHRKPDTAYRYEGAMRLWTAILTELWAQAFLDGRGRSDAS